MGIMCCCYVKKNDDYESLDQNSTNVESSSPGHHRYGTLDVGKAVSARPSETKQYQYPKSPLKQKLSLQSSDSEQRVRHVRIHVSSSDSDESDNDSSPPIRRSMYSSAPPNLQSEYTTKEHVPVVASPSITIETEEEDKDEMPKTIPSALASVIKAEDPVSPTTETARVDAEGASAGDSSDPDDSTEGHSNTSISGNQTGSLDSLNGSEKGGKKTRKSKSVVRKVGSSMKRASRKASKSMQKGMAKMLHPTKGKDNPNETEERGNGQHKSKPSDDEVENQDESSLATPSSPMTPANLSPGPPSPRTPTRPISPGHSPISPGRQRTMSYGRKSPSLSSAHQPLTRMSSDKMQSKYAREKMLEREKQWGKIEAEAQKQDSHKGSAIGQAMQAAHERGQRLKEVEETTDIMRESAFNFAESARHLKEKKRKSAKY